MGGASRRGGTAAWLKPRSLRDFPSSRAHAWDHTARLSAEPLEAFLVFLRSCVPLLPSRYGLSPLEPPGLTPHWGQDSLAQGTGPSTVMASAGGTAPWLTLGMAMSIPGLGRCSGHLLEAPPPPPPASARPGEDLGLASFIHGLFLKQAPWGRPLQHE